jgi:peroxiredoxin Q/BCP
VQREISHTTKKEFAMPKVGELAPDFELVNQDGKKVKLSDYRGKRVLMFAYPKAGTPGCTQQACGFRDAFPKFEASDVVVLGISADKPKDQKKWKDKEKLPYDLLSDESHDVLTQWGVWGEKSFMGRKYMGITRSHWIIGADGRIEDEQIGIGHKDSVKQGVSKAFD